MYTVYTYKCMVLANPTLGASVSPLCKRAHPFWHPTPGIQKSMWGLSVPPLQKSSPFLASHPRNTKKHLGPQCPPSEKELTLFGIQPQEYQKAFGASVSSLCKRAHPFWHPTPDAHKSIWGLSAPPLQKSSPFLASNPRCTCAAGTRPAW